MVTPYHATRLSAWDEGTGGTFDASGSVALDPGESKEIICCLLLCLSVEQAQAYRALEELPELS